MEPRAAFHRKTWILVANAARARIFSYQAGDSDFAPIRDFDFPAGRAKGIELVTDRPGSVQAQGTGHGTRRPATEPRDNAHHHFARELIHHLDVAQGNQQFGHLVLVASLPFLGVLGTHLSPGLVGIVKARVERDLTRASVAEVRDLVLPVLRERRVAVG